MMRLTVLLIAGAVMLMAGGTCGKKMKKSSATTFILARAYFE